ncbi:MAG: glycoside hydrolase family 2 TIM barrel-domain containing protein [Myxococcota bacterium]
MKPSTLALMLGLIGVSFPARAQIGTATAAADAPAESVPVASPGPAASSTPRVRGRSAPKSGPATVKTVKDADGWRLMVDGEPFMVLGMNWDYFPVGTNYSYNFWDQPDAFIKKALDYEMGLMREMGGNSVRVYVGIPKKWITYMYEEHGIWTILNHPMGRYGHNIDGSYVVPTNYADARTREVLTEEISTLVEDYKDTPGLLMWLLGNENNYGLYWASAEIEDLPQMNQADARAVFLYSLFGEIIDEIHARDDRHPVAIANGDLGFINLIAEHCPNLDIMGSNVYRGISSRDLFDEVSEKLDIPFVYTEFGSDAYNARELREDHLAQAEYVRALWQEIYEHSHAKGRAENAIGGMTFQWTDGWWKYRQTENLDVHDETASWSNQAYPFDWAEGLNNMNEEWFGIAAKGLPDPDGFYRIFPRAAYYILQEGYKQDPYAASTTLESIRRHWGNLRADRFDSTYQLSSLPERVKGLEMVRTLSLTSQLETFTTGGEHLDEPERAEERFDSLQSFYIGMGLQPTSRVKGEISLNILGNVAANPINEIYFEDRALPVTVLGPEGEEVVFGDAERIKVYQATFEWDDDWFNLEGFYRSGHFHWAYEGDFFGIYPEANYQPAIDMFNADAPSGFVFTGKKALSGLKVAAGPEIYWGANPSVIAKYYREMGRWEFSLMHQEDIAQRPNAPTSSVIPLPRTRKTSIYLSRAFGEFKFEVGGIMAGTDRLDRIFTIADPVDGPGYLGSGYDILDDRIDWIDTLGARAKITYIHKGIHLYVQGGYRGLVADGGYDQTITFSNFTLRETGKGNNYNVIGGGAFAFGDFKIAPNFMFMKPLVGPNPLIEDLFDRSTGSFFGGVRPRSLLTDPFWVRENRETIGFELVLEYDPTPATWQWAWDAVRREDASFAAFLNFVYRILPTSQDAGVGVSSPEEGGFLFAFPGAPPARDLWEVKGRAIMNPSKEVHIVVNGYGGIVQTTGDDERLVTRGGGDVRLIYKHLNLEGFVKVNDWGPYDFQRDFNLTFPLQVRGDISYALNTPEWFVRAFTRFGAAFTFRTLDQFSPRYLPDPLDPDRLGNEWELRTYVHITL